MGVRSRGRFCGKYARELRILLLLLQLLLLLVLLVVLVVQALKLHDAPTRARSCAQKTHANQRVCTRPNYHTKEIRHVEEKNSIIPSNRQLILLAILLVMLLRLLQVILVLLL